MMIESIVQVWVGQDLALRTAEHLVMFFIALAMATIIGISIGLLIYSNRGLAELTLNIFNVAETIPDIALLIILLPFLKLGSGPTIAASVIYSILPIARNTYTGLSNISFHYLDVASAMGMSSREMLLYVRIPLAFPMMLGGVRIALVFTMGVVTLGGLVAAGGLGAPLQVGIFNYRPDIILVTGVWVGILAVFFDWVAASLEKKVQGHTKC